MTIPKTPDKMLDNRKSRYFSSSRLKLHYSECGDLTAPPLLLLHGFRDHCRSWDWVAAKLQDRFHIIAPDLRGHGDSDWAIGGAYVLDDFVYDLYRMMEELSLPTVSIMAHSMGGAVALDFAGLFPHRVSRLLTIESTRRLERPEPPRQTVTEIASEWMDQLDRLAARPQRKYASVADAQKRLAGANPRLSSTQAHHLTVHGLHTNDDGSLSWKYDPYVRVRGPSRFDRAATKEIWGRTTCPLTLVHGTESGMGDVREKGLEHLFGQPDVVKIAGAGHWVHHDRFDEFMAVAQKALLG